jgi:hypothetical protein
MATSTTSALTDIATAGASVLAASESSLTTDLASITTATTASQLLALQAELAINSTMTATFSGCLKERGDCLKGAAQHIG